MKISTIEYTDENHDYLRRQKYLNKADAKKIVNKLLDEARQLKRDFKKDEDYMHITTKEKLKKAEDDVCGEI